MTAKNITFRRWNSPHCDGADIYAGDDKVGYIAESDCEPYEIEFIDLSIEPRFAGTYEAAERKAREVLA